MSVNSPSSTNVAQASARSYKQRKWFVDFNKKSDRAVAVQQQLATPIGYADHVVDEVTSVEEGTRLIGMRSWEIALGPIKQAPMNVMISWMTGNSIALFPIMFVAMLLFRPFQSMLQMSKAFEAIESDQHSILQKFVYFLGNLVNLGIALYKCHSMGLLPTYASDWLAFANPQEPMEYSFGGVSLQ